MPSSPTKAIKIMSSTVSISTPLTIIIMSSSYIRAWTNNGKYRRHPTLVIFNGKSGILQLISEYVGNPTAQDLLTFRQLIHLLPQGGHSRRWCMGTPVCNLHIRGSMGKELSGRITLNHNDHPFWNFGSTVILLLDNGRLLQGSCTGAPQTSETTAHLRNCACCTGYLPQWDTCVIENVVYTIVPNYWCHIPILFKCCSNSVYIHIFVFVVLI